MAEQVRLTTLASGGGCATKLAAEDLASVLRRLPPLDDPRVLTSAAGFEDAGAIRVSDELAIVQSVDFFTPVVDDPRDFGRIAATNALSDLYAMGAEPLAALAVAGFPRGFPAEIAAAVFNGGIEMAAEAGIAVIGGHTIVDPEPKYGLVVTGTAHPDRLWLNGGARVGDALVLTKSLGTGVIANALRADAAAPDVLAAAIRSMTTLNRESARRVHAAGGPHAATDVTGFGLVGHLHEMALSSGCAMRLRLDDLPLLPGALELARAGFVPGGSRRNREAANAYATFAEGDAALQALACDAQTSGGLLLALPAARAAGLGTVIGTVEEGPPGHVHVG